MNKFIEKIMGISKCEEDDDDILDCDGIFRERKRKDNELKEKLFNYDEDLTFDEFTRLMDIALIKFRNSFGCFNTDYEIVFRKWQI